MYRNSSVFVFVVASILIWKFHRPLLAFIAIVDIILNIPPCSLDKEGSNRYAPSQASFPGVVRVSKYFFSWRSTASFSGGVQCFEGMRFCLFTG